MKIRTKEYLEKVMGDILQIHFESKYYFKDVKYLNNPETSKEGIEAAENLIIRRIRFAFWKLCIIETAKLFQKSKNQHYNLIDFIETLISGYDVYSWIQSIKKETLEEWLKKLNSEKIMAIRDRVKVQRNKYFAHSDKNPDIKLSDIQIDFDEFNELLELTETILSGLKNHCFRIHVDFEVTGMEKAGNILNAFAALKEKRESDIK